MKGPKGSGRVFRVPFPYTSRSREQLLERLQYVEVDAVPRASYLPEEATPVGIRPRCLDEVTTAPHEAVSDAAPSSSAEGWQGGLRPFDTFGGYQLLKRLGAGGMAEVILARHHLGDGLDKLVSLKLVSPKYASHSPLSELFLTEARLSATLQHPNLIQVFDVGSAAGRPFIAMEYVHGCNGTELVQALRERRKPTPITLAVTVAIELAKALEHLHEKRDLDGRRLHLVHRDVSPGNLLISQHGAVKLVDMGVASASIASDHDSLVVGKRAYMSPEQAAGGTPEPGWDIYGLGLVLYELLTLERAFEGITDPATLASARRPRLRPSDLNPQVTVQLDRVVQWATEPDRTRRPSSIRVLRVALEQVRAGLPAFDLVGTMAELFGERLDADQRETEVLIGVARQRDGRTSYRTYRRLTQVAEELVPNRVKLVVARHRQAVFWGLAGLLAVVAVSAVPLRRQWQRESLLAGHLTRADQLVSVSRLVGPGQDTALAQLQAASALRPEDPRVLKRLGALADTFSRLGELAEQRGDVAEAASHFRAALEADAHRTELRARISALEERVRQGFPLGRVNP